jgi:hypothetical protein
VCVCVRLFFSLNTHDAGIVETECGRPKQSASIKVWFVGRVYRMHRKFGNRWVEYMDPI